MISHLELKKRLHYDPSTGFFTWLVAPRSRTHAGEIAGCVETLGYRSIMIRGESYKEHRLAWLYMTGKWPDAEIDHINCVPADNRWCNLREATRAQNAANATKRTDNTSGYKGVHWHRRDCKWTARIMKNHKRINLGYFDTPIAAHNAYIVAANEHFGAFARAR